MQIEEVLKNDIENFYQFVNENDINWTNTNQEIILTCLSLLVNKSFIDLISALRVKHKVPTKWFTDIKLNNTFNDEWVNLHEKALETTLTEYSDEFSDICIKCGVDPKKYNYFVFGYFYLADVKIDVEAIDFPTILDSYKYKSGIEIISGNKPNFTDGPALKDVLPKAFIRFYKDTTINQLHELIDKHKDLIRFVQRNYAYGPSPYPHSKSYGRFKRDIQIYLLHLLGKNAPLITEMIYTVNVPEDAENIKELEKLYSLEDASIRQVIKDINARVHKATIGTFKV